MIVNHEVTFSGIRVPAETAVGEIFPLELGEEEGQTIPQGQLSICWYKFRLRIARTQHWGRNQLFGVMRLSRRLISIAMSGHF